MSPLQAASAFDYMIRESGDAEMISMYEALTEPPNEINEETGVPDWYGSDDEAWAAFQDVLR